MRKIFLLFCLVPACAPFTNEPQNLSELKAEVTEYADSGQYMQDLATSVAGASEYLVRRSKQGGKNLTVIFDIDETVLSNLPHMKEADWGYQPKHWNAWVAESDAPALEPVKKVYQTAIDNGIKVVFLTGRTEADRTATARNLRLQGMGKYEKLILRPNSGSGKTEKAVIFKTRVRKNLTDEGHTVIAGFGDQQSDVEGGYVERKFKLPNPFYKIP
ncbi:MAG: HAD family acid phosphatase [Luteolibacter sp.]